MASRLVTVAATGVAVARASHAGTVNAVSRNITVISASNTTPIVVGATAHLLLPGFQVTINGVTGNTATNGTWLVRSVNVNDFVIENLDHTDTVGNGAYGSGGTIVSTDVLRDSAAAPDFNTPAPTGYRVEIMSGKGQGQVRLVAAVFSSSTLVPNRPWTPSLAVGDAYRIARGTAGILFLKSVIFSVGAGAGAVTLRDGAAGANLLTLSCPASDTRSWATEGQGIPFATSVYVQALSGTGPSCVLEYNVGL